MGSTFQVAHTEHVYSYFGALLLSITSSLYLKLNPKFSKIPMIVLEIPPHSPTQRDRRLCMG